MTTDRTTPASPTVPGGAGVPPAPALPTTTPAASTPPPASPAAAEAAPVVPGEVTERKRLRFDSAYIAPLFITAILVVGQSKFGVLESLPKTLTAIACAIAAEIVLHRVTVGKWPHLASAYITGISVGIILRSLEFWPYAVCSMLSIASKYVLRVKERHIWNPSNFGISVLLFLAAEQATALSVHWDNRDYAMYVIWFVGSVIIWRLRRFHICATFVISFIILSYVRSLITGHPFNTEVAPITGPPYQLFVFFMITDPKTTVKSKAGQCMVAFAVAVMETILRLFEVVHAPYYALFTIGPMALLFEMWLQGRRKPDLPAAGGPASAA